MSGENETNTKRSVTVLMKNGEITDDGKKLHEDLQKIINQESNIDSIGIFEMDEDINAPRSSPEATSYQVFSGLLKPIATR